MPCRQSDFVQVGYSGDEISGVNPGDAMLGIFGYTAR